jgi:hypothetical protein
MAVATGVCSVVVPLILGGVSPGHQISGSTLSSFIGVVGWFLWKVGVVWKSLSEKPVSCCWLVGVTFSVLRSLLPDTPATMLRRRVKSSSVFRLRSRISLSR